MLDQGNAAETQLRSWEAGHYQCRSRKVSGIRISFGKLQGQEGRGSESGCTHACCLSHLPAAPCWDGAELGWTSLPNPSRMGSKKGCTSLGSIMMSLVLPKSAGLIVHRNLLERVVGRLQATLALGLPGEPLTGRSLLPLLVGCVSRCLPDS